MLKNKETGKPHTAMYSTIIGGVVALVCLIGVILNRLPPETLFTFVAPLLGLGAMKNRG